ncbi:serine/threonine-protein kinase [Gordonia spumicola]|nr:serine/threonine-protein kinase [Gordonia spumicola]
MFEVGEEIAGYRVESVLGAGGMGEVYRVRHPRLPRSDALKVLRSAHADSPVVRARFEREADLVAPLTHPNLVRVYDRGALNDLLWIAMELVPGTDAARVIKQSPGGLDARLVANIVDGTAAALDVAHRNGILHRDVKPANILITPGPDPIVPEAIKVTDFGIAQAIGDAEGNLTGTGTTVGTMRYCSPEQINGRAMDGRSDLYSLAATAFELLTGSSPYDSQSLQGMMTAHLFAEPPRASQRNRSLPPAVDAVLAFGLAKDPNQRPPSCVAFAQALRAALFEGRAPVVPPSFANTPGAPVRPVDAKAYAPNFAQTGAVATLQPAAPRTPWFARTAVLATAAVLVAAALGIGGGFLWSSGDALATPSGFTAKSTDQGVELSWNGVSGADSYMIRQDDTVIRSVADTSYTIGSPFAGTHTYSVAARSTTKQGSDFASSGPITVTLTWAGLRDVANLYPGLVPSSPITTNGFEGLRCRGAGPHISDRYPNRAIICQKKDGDTVLYSVFIAGFTDATNARYAAGRELPFTAKTEFVRSAQGAKGSITTGSQNGAARSVWAYTGDDDDPRAKTFVEVEFPNPKDTAKARELLGRLPF